MIVVAWSLPDRIDPRIIGELGELLDAAESERLERLQQGADRRAYALAHVLRRIELAAWTGLEPATSISHVRSCVVCALGEDAALGVDVEEIGRVVLDSSTLRAACTPREIAAVVQSPHGDERDRSFAAVWTRKEACFKAVAAGKLPAFSAFDAQIDPPALGLFVETFYPTPRHVVSVARSTAGTPVLRQVDEPAFWRALQSARAAR